MSEDVPDAVALTHRPTVAAGVGAIAAAVVAVVVAGIGSPSALPVGLAGAAVLLAGLARPHRTGVDLGALVVFAGVVVGGLESDAIGPTVVATVAAVVAWDLAHGAIDLGEQLGRESPTLRLEAVLFGSSLLVGLLVGTVGYAVYVFGAGGQPVGGLVLLLVAAVSFTLALRPVRPDDGR